MEQSTITESVRHILVAEDNPDDLLLLKRAFMKAGYSVAIHDVQDGDQAIAYLSGEGVYADRIKYPKPDIILLDIKMPRKSGIEVLKWLKANPEHQVIPTIMMSASNLEDDIEASYQNGANTFFMKPGNYEDLISLAKMLNNYWQQAKKPLRRK